MQHNKVKIKTKTNTKSTRRGERTQVDDDDGASDSCLRREKIKSFFTY